LAEETKNTVGQTPKLDYAFLKGQGIAYIQQLAGKVWTDYNEHDPGITILEELCFVIRDLEYRTNFYLEDLLADDPNRTGDDDNKDFYTAEEILPCNPLTIEDFIKVAADVPGVRNVKIIPSQKGQEIQGGYHVFLDLEEKIIARQQEATVLEAVGRKLYGHRNLCEDFFEISQLQPLYIRTDIALEVKSDITHEQGERLLAEVLFAIRSFISPQIKFYSLRNMLLDKRKTVAEIFTGPLLEQGFIDEEELKQSNAKRVVYVSEMLEQITEMDQVTSVTKFSVALDEDEEAMSRMVLEVPDDRVLKLNVAQSSLAIYYNGSPVPVSMERVMQYFEHIVSTHAFNRSFLAEEEIAFREGRYRGLSKYISIQHEFPLVYGVGKEGLPLSASPERKAQANQLKAYLTFFDQLFANYLAQLAHVKDVLAVTSRVRPTHFSQVLQDVPRFHTLMKVPTPNHGDAQSEDHEFATQRKYLGVYPKIYRNNHEDDAAQLQEAYQYYLNKIVENKEQHRLKKSSILDHLLARFSETFTAYSLLIYNASREKASNTMMQNKMLFLQDYIAISRDRNKGFDVLEDEHSGWDTENISGFERRLCRLLGIKNLKRRFLYDSLESNFYVEQGSDHQSLEIFLTENLQSKYDSVFIFKGNFPQIRNLAIEHGVEEASYEIVEKPESGYDITLCINRKEQKFIKLVNKGIDIKSIEQAQSMIRQAVKFFQDFNEKSEGFDLVEHILLRSNTSLQGSNDPYSFIMTLVLPSWPARFQKEAFRTLVNELVISESPAHVFVNLLWLDLEEMESFEKAYKQWINLKTTVPEDDEQLHHAAKNLLGLIILYSRDRL